MLVQFLRCLRLENRNVGGIGLDEKWWRPCAAKRPIAIDNGAEQGGRARSDTEMYPCVKSMAKIRG